MEDYQELLQFSQSLILLLVSSGWQQQPKQMTATPSA